MKQQRCTMHRTWKYVAPLWHKQHTCTTVNVKQPCVADQSFMKTSFRGMRVDVASVASHSHLQPYHAHIRLTPILTHSKHHPYACSNLLPLRWRIWRARPQTQRSAPSASLSSHSVCLSSQSAWRPLSVMWVSATCATSLIYQPLAESHIHRHRPLLCPTCTMPCPSQARKAHDVVRNMEQELQYMEEKVGLDMVQCILF